LGIIKDRPKPGGSASATNLENREKSLNDLQSFMEDSHTSTRKIA